jgi:hypothetical protein
VFISCWVPGHAERVSRGGRCVEIGIDGMDVNQHLG